MKISSIDATEIQQKQTIKPKKLVLIKKNLTELILISTCHGFPSVVRSNRVAFKIMWLFFSTVSLSLGCYMLYKNVLDYLNYDVIIQVKTIKEIPTEFPTLTFHFEKNGGRSLKEYLISCEFNGIPCSSDEFEVLHEFHGEPYFKFNSGVNIFGHNIPLKMTKLGGRNRGFSAKFLIGEGNISSLHIHNKSIDTGEIDEDFIFFSPGFETTLKISRVFTTKLGQPHNNCQVDLVKEIDFDSFLFKHIIRRNYSYRQKDCFDLCLSKYLIDKCNKSISLDNLWSIYYKTMDENMKVCFDDEYNTFFDMDVNNYCGPQCPLECDSITYDYSSSFIYLNEYDYPYFENKQKPFAKDIVSLHVYYEDTTYTSVNEIPKIGLVDLLSSMGGLLGLFLGISFLSFFELLEILFEVVITIFD